jgi:hypothetical protein
MRDTAHNTTARFACSGENIAAQHLFQEVEDNLYAGDISFFEGCDTFRRLPDIYRRPKGDTIVPNFSGRLEIIECSKYIVISNIVNSAVVELVKVDMIGP